MNAYLRFDGIELWQLAGWTMLHFLWLGTLVGLVAGALRLLLRQTLPNVRYVTAVTTLVVLASLPLSISAWLVITYPTDFLSEDTPAAVGFAVGPTATPAQISPPIDQSVGAIIELSGRNETTPSDKAPTARGLPGGLPADGDLTSDQAAVPAAASTARRLSRGLSDDASADISPKAALVESLQSFAQYLPWIWLVGTPITFALLATGVVGTRRLRLASKPINDGPIAGLLAQLVTSLQIGSRVGLAVCDRIATPVLVGILRPMILLPPAALTGWSPDEIEMVLLHELAHVRRWDNLVNFVQRIVESLLFFHPVVWLVSNWIRREREACCDALVVDRTKKPHAYAELLVALAAELPRSVLFQPAASSAMAAGPMRNRIRRILQLEDDPMLVSGKSFVLVLGALLAAATLAVLYLPTIGQAEESTTETSKPTTEDTENTESSQVSPSDNPELKPLIVPLSFALKRNESGQSQLYLNNARIAEDVMRTMIQSRKQFIDDQRVTLSIESTLAAAEVQRVVDLLRALGVKQLTVNTMPDANPKFPSLEDQKLADLAFKRLGLELETLDDEDLRRVKAIGYGGGVKVTSGAAGTQHTFIQTTDIIVGLHVWPTTNLQDVAAVLNRDDLAELNPLKFYVVRKRGDESNKDEVITGRVSVNLPAGGWGATRSTAPAAPQSAAPPGDLRTYVAEAMTDAGIDPQAGPVQVETVPHEGGSTLVVRGPVTVDSDVPSYVLPSAAEEDRHPTPKQEILGAPTPPEPKAPSKPTATPSRPGSSPTNLRYEGKTFEEWRDASRIELSTERQLAAVQALAAFGANGYAREATDAILDVAAKHDFGAQSSRDSAESRLKFAIYDSFTSRRSIGKSIAFPMIFQRYERAPETWHDFVVYVLSRPPSLPSEVIAPIRTLLEHEKADMRAAALEAIYQSVPAERAELLNAALRDPDPNVVRTGLQFITTNESQIKDGGSSSIVDFPFDAYLNLLFRSDKGRPDESRDLARNMLTADLSPQSIDQILVRLTAILNDASKQDEHLKVIREMRQIARGPRTAKHNAILASHKSALDRAFSESKDVQLRAAAAYALYDFVGSTQRINQLQKEAQDLPRDAREQMQQLIAAEEEAEW